MARIGLAIDCSNLAYRNYFGGSFDPDQLALSIVYFAMRMVESDRFTHVLWCFDRPPYRRTKLLVDYKQGKEVTQDREQAKNVVDESLRKLRYVLRRYEAGAILGVQGFEADDLLASVSYNLLSSDRLVLIGTDSDLYQLLSAHVCLYDLGRRRYYTISHFRSDYGIDPIQWPRVKALAGCPTDNIRGVDGVGIKRAIKYLKGSLSPRTTAHARILCEHQRIALNTRLVDLPFDGTPAISMGVGPCSYRQLYHAAKALSA